MVPYPYYTPNRYGTNGITFIADNDGIITINGTATNTAYYLLYYGNELGLEIGKTYTVTLEVENGTADLYLANYTSSNTDIAWCHSVKDTKKSMIFTYTQVSGWKGDSIGIYVVPAYGKLTNCKVRVQLERGSISHSYQPPTLSNITLKNAIKKGPTTNLIPYPYLNTTNTANGITWTDNSDGTITANGTATKDSIFLLPSFSVSAGTYTISGSPNISGCSIQLARSGNDWSMVSTSGSSKTITYTESVNFSYCRCLILEGTTVSYAVFKPQLERGTIVHDYTPYIESHVVSWTNVSGKPSTFTPATHSHAWSEITGKPSTFTPAAHTHAYVPTSGGAASYLATIGKMLVGNTNYGDSWNLQVTGGALFANDVDIRGRIYNASFNGTPIIRTLDGTDNRYPIGSWGTDGKRVSSMGVDIDGNLKVSCQNGNAGSGYTSYVLLENVSDIRLKENVEDSTIDALSLIRKIKIRKFKWKGLKHDKNQAIGFIADELEKLDSDFTAGGGLNDDGSMDIKTIDTLYLDGYVVKAIKEIDSIISKLQQRVTELEKRLS